MTEEVFADTGVAVGSTVAVGTTVALGVAVGMGVDSIDAVEVAVGLDVGSTVTVGTTVGVGVDSTGTGVGADLDSTMTARVATGVGSGSSRQGGGGRRSWCAFDRYSVDRRLPAFSRGSEFGTGFGGQDGDGDHPCHANAQERHGGDHY